MVLNGQKEKGTPIGVIDTCNHPCSCRVCCTYGPMPKGSHSPWKWANTQYYLEGNSDYSQRLLDALGNQGWNARAIKDVVIQMYDMIKEYHDSFKGICFSGFVRVRQEGPCSAHRKLWGWAGLKLFDKVIDFLLMSLLVKLVWSQTAGCGLGFPTKKCRGGKFHMVSEVA